MTLVYTPENSVSSCQATASTTSFEEFLQVLQSLTLTPYTLTIDLDRHSVTAHGVSVALSRQEFHLLSHLVLNADEAVSREELLTTVWGNREIKDGSRTVDAHIRRLRKKLESADLISTIRGQGYRYNSCATVRVINTRIRLASHTLAG